MTQVEIMKVIKVIIVRGQGVESNPVRNVTQYFNLEGDFIFEIDPCVEK